MEFSFDTPNTDGPPNPSALGSDRLKKAIERNRAKQAKRTAKNASVESASTTEENWSLPKGPRSSSSRSSSSATRRSVGSADNVEFTQALRKRTKRAPANFDYPDSSPAKVVKTPTVVKKRKSTKVTRSAKPVTSKSKRKILKNANQTLVKGVWVFCFFLLLRLIFSDGGVRDFYAKKDVLTARFDRSERIENENKALVAEIKKLRSSVRYQKKVVRDHLGYIARDEYLVLFSN